MQQEGGSKNPGLNFDWVLECLNARVASSSWKWQACWWALLCGYILMKNQPSDSFPNWNQRNSSSSSYSSTWWKILINPTQKPSNSFTNWWNQRDSSSSSSSSWNPHYPNMKSIRFSFPKKNQQNKYPPKFYYNKGANLARWVVNFSHHFITQTGIDLWMLPHLMKYRKPISKVWCIYHIWMWSITKRSYFDVKCVFFVRISNGGIELFKKHFKIVEQGWLMLQQKCKPSKGHA